MSIIKDPLGNYTPERKNLKIAGTLASINAELLIDVNAGVTMDSVLTLGGGEGIGMVEVRGTFVGTINIEGSVNGTDYTPLVTTLGIQNIAMVGVYKVNCSGYNIVRARMIAYTSGSAITTLTLSKGAITERGTTAVATGLGTAAAALTLTIPAVAGMRHYITRIEIWRVNGTASAVVGSAILAITSTNLPANYGWSVGNGLGAWAHEKLIDTAFDSPLVSTALGTATTIVMPAGGAGIQWRCNVHYRLGE